MRKNSSKKGDSRTLAAKTKAREFLLELANLLDEKGAMKRFEERWRYWFQAEIPTHLVYDWAIQGEEEEVAELSEEERLRKYWLVPLRSIVRHVWRSDSRTKTWGIFSLLERLFGVGFRDAETGPWTTTTQWHQGYDLPAESNCERTFNHLKDRTAVCGNKDCLTPYFFPVRSTQKYCSPECAAPAQREFKRGWWNRKGPVWRAKRATELRRESGTASKKK